MSSAPTSPSVVAHKSITEATSVASLTTKNNPLACLGYVEEWNLVVETLSRREKLLN
jgi:hypothetical protein